MCTYLAEVLSLWYRRATSLLFFVLGTDFPHVLRPLVFPMSLALLVEMWIVLLGFFSPGPDRVADRFSTACLPSVAGEFFIGHSTDGHFQSRVYLLSLALF